MGLTKYSIWGILFSIISICEEKMQQTLCKKMITFLNQILIEKLSDFSKAKKEYECAIKIAGKINCQPICIAFEQRVFTALLFAAQQGYEMNLLHFKNPTFDLLTEGYLNEEEIFCLPGYIEASRTIKHLAKHCSDELYFALIEYYTFLETAGCHFYHYYGFLVANRLLPYFIPNYECDLVYTAEYRRWLANWFGVDLTPEELL